MKITCSLNCDVCKQLLVDPMMMSCGKFFCKSHLTQLINNRSRETNTFICGICQKKHDLPKSGFKVNNRLQHLVKLQLNKLEQLAMFEGCKKELENAKESVVKIELLERNAENYSYDYFEEIKRQVENRREDLKIKIDNYSDEIIKSVELNQKNFIKLSKEVNQITENIEKSKKEFDMLTSRFDTLEFNDKKFEDIKASVKVVNQEFHKILAGYQDSLIDNKKYTFEFKDMPIEDIFGRVFDVQVNF